MRRLLHRKGIQPLQITATVPEPKGCMTCRHKNARTEYTIPHDDGRHHAVVHCAIERHNGGYLVERVSCSTWEPGDFGVIANLCDACAWNVNRLQVDYAGPITCSRVHPQRKYEIHKCSSYKHHEELYREVIEEEEQRLAHIERQREMWANRPWYIRALKRTIERLTADRKHAPATQQERRPGFRPPPAHDD